MSKYPPRSPFTSIFTSKRFVVALCAAIAMVLGAMSVGANTRPIDKPTDNQSLAMASQKDDLAYTKTQFKKGTPTGATQVTPLKQQLLAPIIPQKNDNIAAVDPSARLEVKLKLLPLDTSPSDTGSLAPVLFKTENDLLEPLVSDQATTDAVPLQANTTDTPARPAQTPETTQSSASQPTDTQETIPAQ
jgi:hypothetical protein